MLEDAHDRTIRSFEHEKKLLLLELASVTAEMWKNEETKENSHSAFPTFHFGSFKPKSARKM